MIIFIKTGYTHTQKKKESYQEFLEEDVVVHELEAVEDVKIVLLGEDKGVVDQSRERGLGDGVVIEVGGIEALVDRVPDD